MELIHRIAVFYIDLFMHHAWLFVASCTAAGLFIGSFLNVVALRLPGHQSIVYPPSHCVHCKHRLSVPDLVPVFSYLFLRGKCRYCAAPISPIYPLGELACAGLFGWLAAQLGPVPELLPALFMAAILTAVTLTDLKYMIIPNKLIAFALIGGLLLRLWIHPLPLWHYLLAMAGGGVTLYAIAWLSIWLFKKEGMGGGDIKLFLFIGLMLGMPLTLLTLFIASLFGTLFSIAAMAAGKLARERAIPFGPFIAAGAMLSYVYGQTWIDGYLSLFY